MKQMFGGALYEPEFTAPATDGSPKGRAPLS